MFAVILFSAIYRKMAIDYGNTLNKIKLLEDEIYADKLNRVFDEAKQARSRLKNDKKEKHMVFIKPVDKFCINTEESKILLRNLSDYASPKKYIISSEYVVNEFNLLIKRFNIDYYSYAEDGIMVKYITRNSFNFIREYMTKKSLLVDVGKHFIIDVKSIDKDGFHFVKDSELFLIKDYILVEHH